jgi:RNA polymerase sigma-70 factor (ECF subfamily)
MQDEDEIAALLARIARRDRRAFRTFYGATSAQLFGLCLRILRDRAVAEEVAQEIFVKLWRNADSFDPARGSGRAWVLTVARNHAIDRLRRRRAGGARHDDGPEALERVADPGPGPAESLVAKQGRAAIDACLEELAETRARAVRLAYLEGASYAELAALFDVPLNTMRSWLRRSLLALKECLSR